VPRQDRFPAKKPQQLRTPDVRTYLAECSGMLTWLAAGFGAWFVAALATGIALGKLISAHERSGVQDAQPAKPSAPRAA